MWLRNAFLKPWFVSKEWVGKGYPTSLHQTPRSRWGKGNPTNQHQTPRSGCGKGYPTSLHQTPRSGFGKVHPTNLHQTPRSRWSKGNPTKQHQTPRSGCGKGYPNSLHQTPRSEYGVGCKTTYVFLERRHLKIYNYIFILRTLVLYTLIVTVHHKINSIVLARVAECGAYELLTIVSHFNDNMSY